MKILISIIFNSFLLYLLAYLLWPNSTWTLPAWISVVWWFKTYLIWWLIIWLINITIKPILKLFSIPLYFVFFGLVSFVINWIILVLFDYIINDILIIPWISYSITWEWIDWWINYIIVVAIFTFLNMIYSLLIFKK